MPRFDPKEVLIHVECGDKNNYAACYLPEQDGDLVFLGWISKRCYKYGIKMEVSADDLGITYKGWMARHTETKREACPEEIEDKSDEEYIIAQNMSWAEFGTPV